MNDFMEMLYESRAVNRSIISLLLVCALSMYYFIIEITYAKDLEQPLELKCEIWIAI